MAKVSPVLGRGAGKQPLKRLLPAKAGRSVRPVKCKVDRRRGRDASNTRWRLRGRTRLPPELPNYPLSDTLFIDYGPSLRGPDMRDIQSFAADQWINPRLPVHAINIASAITGDVIAPTAGNDALAGSWQCWATPVTNRGLPCAG